MTDPTVGPDRIETRDDLDPGEAGVYEFWTGQERIAEKDERKWVKRAREVVKRYRDERPEAMGNTHRYNILWSNVQTLKPSLYGRTPRPDVERRFKDQDDTGRLASELLQRAISYTFDQTDFDRLMSACVEDKLLPGRGTARVLYVPHFGEVLNERGDNAEFEETEDAPSVIDSDGDRGDEGGADAVSEVRALSSASDAVGDGEPDAGDRSARGENLREVVYEEARLDYVFWEDYREGPARTWREVPWVRYRAYMTRDELVARFGAKGKKVNLDYVPQGGTNLSKEDPPPDIYKKAVVHEYWDKVKMQVVWLAPGTDDIILDTADDPLKLPDFFPSPDPLLSTTTNNTRIPVPDYIEYQDQARELDTLTARIDKLQRALKISGIYPGENKQVLQQLIDEGTENRLIPVEDWAAWSDKGGLANFIQWFPVEQIAQVLLQLYEARDKIKATLYEITGIGDIMRGNTVPNETATAQMLKTNFVTRRVQPQQKEVARFARDLVRLTGSIIAEHFSAKTISMITGYPKLKPVPQVPPKPIPPMMPPALPAPQQNVVPMHPGMPVPQQQPQQPPNPQMIAFQQQMAMWQQANAKAQQIVMANQQAQQQFDEAVALIKQDGVHGFRIDIEADSTVAPDEEADKASRIEFLSKFVPLMEQSAMFAQGNPALASLAKEVVLFGVRGFRVARPLEEAIEGAFDALGQMPPNPNGAAGKGKGAQQNPQIEQAKIQAGIHDTDVKAKTDMLEIAQKSQEAQQHDQMEAAKTAAQLDDQRQDRMIQAAELAQRERLENMRIQTAENRLTRGLV